MHISAWSKEREMINWDRSHYVGSSCAVSLLLGTVDIYGFLYDVKHTERLCCGWSSLVLREMARYLKYHKYHSTFTEVLLCHCYYEMLCCRKKY